MLKDGIPTKDIAKKIGRTVLALRLACRTRGFKVSDYDLKNVVSVMVRSGLGSYYITNVFPRFPKEDSYRAIADISLQKSLQAIQNLHTRKSNKLLYL